MRDAAKYIFCKIHLQRGSWRPVATATNSEEEYQLSLLHLILSHNSLKARKSKNLPGATGEQGTQHTSPTA